VTKLVQLIPGMARALGVAEGTVRLAASGLRKHGLVTTGGRGPGGAVMNPTDAANILLAIMGSDQVTYAYGEVPFLRSLAFVGSELNWNGEWRSDLPDFEPVNDGGSALLFGETVENLIDNIVRYGDLSDDKRTITNLTLQISYPAYAAEIVLDDGSEVWCLRFQQTEYPDKVGRMVTSREIDLPSLFMIGEALRGYRPKSGEVVNPAYVDAPATPKSVKK
jgi:hypothetical protein